MCHAHVHALAYHNEKAKKATTRHTCATYMEAHACGITCTWEWAHRYYEGVQIGPWHIALMEMAASFH